MISQNISIFEQISLIAVVVFEFLFIFVSAIIINKKDRGNQDKYLYKNKMEAIGSNSLEVLTGFK